MKLQTLLIALIIVSGSLIVFLSSNEEHSFNGVFVGVMVALTSVAIALIRSRKRSG